MSKLLKLASVGIAASALFLTGMTGVAHAAGTTAPFSQCPPVGADTSCRILLVINANGSVTVLTDSGVAATYDGFDDTLVGVQNNSTHTVPSLHLTATSNPPAFEFDHDGLCAFVLPCFGPTGYEGPRTSFTNISANQQSGDVIFTGGLAPGAAAYFSLEGAITAQGLTFNTPPDCSNATIGINDLWPPNHKMHVVTVTGITDVDPLDSVVTTVTGVTQDEPTNGLGDGDTAIDAVLGSRSNQVSVRAERSGLGDGRVYVIAFKGTDTSGAECTGTATIGVPHDQRPGAVAVNSGQSYNSLI